MVKKVCKVAQHNKLQPDFMGTQFIQLRKRAQKKTKKKINCAKSHKKTKLPSHIQKTKRKTKKLSLMTKLLAVFF